MLNFVLFVWLLLWIPPPRIAALRGPTCDDCGRPARPGFCLPADCHIGRGRP
jgi:hypothetical protein